MDDELTFGFVTGDCQNGSSLVSKKTNLIASAFDHDYWYVACSWNSSSTFLLTAIKFSDNFLYDLSQLDTSVLSLSMRMRVIGFISEITSNCVVEIHAFID